MLCRKHGQNGKPLYHCPGVVILKKKKVSELESQLLPSLNTEKVLSVFKAGQDFIQMVYLGSLVLNAAFH